MVATRSGLPADILNKLHGELKSILAQPDVREQIARFGMIPVDSPPPAELHRYVGSETARWSKIVQQAGAAGIE
jgi:tripartite-type tricarboxylate transporter receptor subunit TctC